MAKKVVKKLSSGGSAAGHKYRFSQKNSVKTAQDKPGCTRSCADAQEGENKSKLPKKKK
jgi:hypothetical protein